ncbi:unnamed protein product, partial [Effrenium voratum]
WGHSRGSHAMPGESAGGGRLCCLRGAAARGGGRSLRELRCGPGAELRARAWEGQAEEARSGRGRCGAAEDSDQRIQRQGREPRGGGEGGGHHRGRAFEEGHGGRLPLRGHALR